MTNPIPVTCAGAVTPLAHRVPSANRVIRSRTVPILASTLALLVAWGAAPTLSFAEQCSVAVPGIFECTVAPGDYTTSQTFDNKPGSELILNVSSGARISTTGGSAVSAVHDLTTPFKTTINLAKDSVILLTNGGFFGVGAASKGDVNIHSDARIVLGPNRYNRGYDASSYGGNTSVTLGRAGSIVGTNGSAGTVGMHTRTYWQGRADFKIEGEISMSGQGIDGAKIERFGPNAGDSSVEITETGRIVVGGTGQNHGARIDLNSEVVGGKAQIVSNGYVEATGDNGRALYINNMGRTHADDLSIVMGSTSHTVAKRADTGATGMTGANVATRGLGATSILSDGIVDVSGDKSWGLYSGILNLTSTANAAIVVGKTGRLNLTGSDSVGVFVYNEGKAGTGDLLLEEGGQVTVDGRNTAALKVGGGAEMKVGVGGDVSAVGEGAVALDIASRGAAAVTIGSKGAMQGGSGTGSAGIKTTYGDGSGASLVVDNFGKVGALSDRAILSTGVNKSREINNSGTITGFIELGGGESNVVTNKAGGRFELRNFVAAEGQDRDTKSVAITDFGSATTRTFYNEDGATVSLGDVSSANVTEAAGYYAPVNGDASIYDFNRKGIAQGQFVNLANFNHAGVIDLRGEEVGNSLVITNGANAATPGNGVFTSNSGWLRLNAALNDSGKSYADVLVVDGVETGTGATKILVDKRGTGGPTTGNGVLLVEVRDKDNSSGDAFKLAGQYQVNGVDRMTLGLYSYGLYHNGVDGDAADGNWYLRSAGDYSPHISGYQNAPIVLSSLIDTPTLRQRVGDRIQTGAGTSASTGEYASGPWARVVGSRAKFSLQDASIPGTLDLNNYMVQFGYDGVVGQTETGVVIAGINGSYRSASGKTGDNTISASGFGLGGALTYYDDSGFYLDGQANVVWSGAAYSSSTLGELATGVAGVGYGVSLEAGHRFKLDENWSITPHAQVGYTSATSDSFVDPYGLQVNLGTADSLKVRLGVSADYKNEWTEADGTKSSFKAYGVADVTVNAAQGHTVTVGSQALSTGSDPVWVGVGVGAQYDWNDGKASIFGQVGAKTSLNDFGSSYALQAQVGMKVRF